MSLLVVRPWTCYVEWHSDLYWGDGPDHVLLADPKYREIRPGLVAGGVGDLGFIYQVWETLSECPEAYKALWPTLLREQLTMVPDDTELVLSIGANVYCMAQNFELMRVESPVVVLGVGGASFSTLAAKYGMFTSFDIMSVLHDEVKGYRTDTYGPFQD